MANHTSSARLPSVSGDTLRVLLFGLPGAGKTSLLAALAEIAESQSATLNGRLVDVEKSLATLRKQFQDGTIGRTTEEVVLYRVAFDPFRDESHTARPERRDLLLIDSDGRKANELLDREITDASEPSAARLAGELARADVLLLLVDGSVPATQLDAHFAEFEHFLQALERQRGRQTKIGGLPVFLVLTKCDLLSGAQDTPIDWMERIEERKRELGERFRGYLAKQSPIDGTRRFGTIDLHLWATAVRRPTFQELFLSSEPYGVAELFRQALDSGAVFQTRGKLANERLLWTLCSAFGLMAGMVALAAWLALNNHSVTSSRLQMQIENARFGDARTPEQRLHGSLAFLRQRLGTWTSLYDDPDFPALPTPDQDFVQSRIEEFDAYIPYVEQVQAVVRPADVFKFEELRQIAEKLQSMSPPRPDWSATDAGKKRGDELAEANAILTAVREATRWYEDDHDKMRDLWTFAKYDPKPNIDWRAWQQEVGTLLAPSHKAPFDEHELIAGTEIPWAVALRFDRVLEARIDWEAMKARLTRVRAIAAALGLGGPVAGLPDVLVIPRANFTLNDAKNRLDALRRAYPDFAASFTLTGLPDAALPEIRHAARVNYENLLVPAQAAVLQHLQQAGTGEEETPARWANVASWLASAPPELAAWRTLAQVLTGLDQTKPVDPVSELATFLQQTSFPIEIRLVTLEVPEAFRAMVQPEASEKLSIYLPSAQADGPAIICESAGDAVPDGHGVLTYTFRPTAQTRLTYRPGDALWATLPLRDGQMLTWARSRSTQYQFERLARPPRLHKADEPNSSGKLLEGVRLIVTPADGVPRVPDLLPVVRLLK